MKNMQTISNIEDCFDRYEKIQARHLEAMETQSMPDLECMTQERSDLFQTLIAQVESFISDAGTRHGSDSLATLSKFENRLESMMMLDDKIKIEIIRHREDLKIHLTRMKKGKNAMNGYKNAVSSSRTPRVLSMNR
ncbi:MAG: hypothetical protein ABIJ59_17345 [Pseudomonadota bacterium]